jgi:hypothetical protein
VSINLVGNYIFVSPCDPRLDGDHSIVAALFESRAPDRSLMHNHHSGLVSNKKLYVVVTQFSGLL